MATQSLKSLDLPLKPLRLVAKMLLGTFAVLITSLILIPWQQTSKGSGRVIAYSPNERPQSIEAPVEGRVAHWYVQEGSVVRKGDLLVEISDNDPQILTRLHNERDATLDRLSATERAIQATKKNLERQRSLEKQGLSSRRAMELADLEYARYLTDAANASAELALIEVRLARQQAQTISANADGFISRVFGGQGGEMVKSGDVLMTIVPETKSRAVELWVKGNDVPLLSEGRHVRLQFEGWPAIQFSGWPSVAVGTFGGKIAVIDATDNGKGEFRVLIVPDGDQGWPSGRYLRQGIRTYGWILLNQVSLGYEIWRQFNGFPPIIASDEPPLAGKGQKQ